MSYSRSGYVNSINTVFIKHNVSLIDFLRIAKYELRRNESAKCCVRLPYMSKILRLSPSSVLNCTQRVGTCEKCFLLIKGFSHMQHVCDVHGCHGKKSSSLVQKITPRRHCRVKEHYTEWWKHFEWQGQFWTKITFKKFVFCSNGVWFVWNRDAKSQRNILL
jgi:hypothetical protein